MKTTFIITYLLFQFIALAGYAANGTNQFNNTTESDMMNPFENRWPSESSDIATQDWWDGPGGTEGEITEEGDADYTGMPVGDYLIPLGFMILIYLLLKVKHTQQKSEKTDIK